MARVVVYKISLKQRTVLIDGIVITKLCRHLLG